MRVRHPFIGRVILVAAASLAGVASASGRAQTQGPGSNGLAMGVIVDAVTDRPVANVQVTLGGTAAVVRNAQLMTDAEGRFVFLDLPRGSYTITATKAGYSEGAFGRRRPGGPGQTLTLAADERFADLKIPIWKHAAITGAVHDELGDPMVNLPVQVLQPIFRAGRLRLIPGAIVRTDDRGAYRIGSLAPGDYIVVVPSTQTTAPQSVVAAYRDFMGLSSGPGAVNLNRDMSFSGGQTALTYLGRGRDGVPTVAGLAFLPIAGNMAAGVVPGPSRDGKLYVFPTQYFPGVTSPAHTTTLTVRSGEERSGVDIQLRQVATSRVSGSVTGPAGPLVAVMTLSAVAEPSAESGLETAMTVSDADGRFTFLGVPPGQYLLRAIRAEVPPIAGMSRGGAPPAATKGPPPSSLPGYTLSATQSITVDTSDTDDLKLTLHAGFRISGRAEFANAPAPPDPKFVRGMSATFDPVDARPLVSSTIGRGQFEDNGNLWSYQLPPGRYYLRINNPPPGWTLRSAMWNGRDISNTPFELDRDIGGVRITFTDRPSTLSVQAQNATGAADTTATVLVFPADASAWVDYGGFPRRLRAVRVDKDGRCTVLGLPAGRYLVAAVDEEVSADWQNPRTLQAFARLATTITFADGESQHVAIKTMAAPPR